jgi:hypothetical protein
MSCAIDRRPVLPFTSAVVVLVAAVLGGTLLMYGWEWGWQQASGGSAVPATRLDRRAIVLQLSIWCGCCVAAAVAARGTWRRMAKHRPISGNESIAAAVAGLVGCIAVLASVGPNDVLAVSLWGAVILGIAWRFAGVVDSVAATSLAFPVALVGWAAADVVTAEPISVARLATALVIALLCNLLMARPALPRPWLAIMPLAVPLALEAVRCQFELATGLLAALAYAAGVGRVGGVGARAGRCWCLAAAAACLFATMAGAIPSEDTPRRFLAGLTLASAVHAFARRWQTLRLPDAALWRSFGQRRELLVIGCVLAAVALRPLVGVVLGLALAGWQSTNGEGGADPETSDSSTGQRRRWIVWGFAASAVLARAVFWAVTDRVWEDALITIRHAENAVAGAGLTHHPAHGHVHGFTSAISVLIPLVGEWLQSGLALAALRVSSLLAAGVTVLLAARLAAHRELALSNPALAIWLAYLAFDHSQIAFGMAGMETQIWTCVLLAGACAFAYDRPVWLGLALAAAAWCRPDGVLWIGLCGIATLSSGWRRAAIALGIAVAGFAPWLAFTWLYYGSITPNTVLAKAAGYAWHAEIVTAPGSFVAYVVDELRYGLPTLLAILPPNFRGHGLVPVPTVPAPKFVLGVLLFLGAIGSVQLCRRRLWPVVLFPLAYAAFLVLIVQCWFAWYPLPVLALAALLPAVGFEALRRLVRWLPLWQWSLAGALIAAYAAPLPWTFATEARIQSLVENGVRRRVGVWLKEHAAPGDYVAAECLGYLGYYSGLAFHDYPGLVSPRVVEAVRRRPPGIERSLAVVVADLRPKWLALRPEELGCVAAEYEEVAVIALSPDERAALRKFLPITTADAEFHIFRRR